MDDLIGKDSRKPDEKKAALKKPYLKPAFKYERVSLTTALSCRKIDSSKLQRQSKSSKAS